MSERQETVNPSMAWKAVRDAEQTAPNQFSNFWQLPSTQRAEAALDAWASVAMARLYGISETPTMSAILAIDTPFDDNPVAFRTEGPNTVSVLERIDSANRELRELEDGTEAMVWLVRFVERFIERFSPGSTRAEMPAAKALYLTTEAWFEDIGDPPLLRSFFSQCYPRTGPYQARVTKYHSGLMYGEMRLGRTAGLAEKAFGALHRDSLRDLSDFMADFGVKERSRHELKKVPYRKAG